jgi:hypothetical protein
MKLRVIAVRPDRPEGYITNVSNEFQNLRRFVGGHIETLTLHFPEGDFVVICDDEGRIKGKQQSAFIGGFDFCGDILIAGVDGEEFADIPEPIEELWRGGGLLG